MDTILSLQGLPTLGSTFEGGDSACNCQKSSTTSDCSTSSCTCIEGASADMFF